MDYLDAIMEILDAAGQVKLPHHRLHVVTFARREFAKRGCCDDKFIAPIESILLDDLRKWSFDQKKEIWLSTETGAAATAACDDPDEDRRGAELLPARTAKHEPDCPLPGR